MPERISSLESRRRNIWEMRRVGREDVPQCLSRKRERIVCVEGVEK